MTARAAVASNRDGLKSFISEHKAVLQGICVLFIVACLVAGGGF